MSSRDTTPAELPSGRTPPRFSLVVAAYNVARYLSPFLESVEAQLGGELSVEVIIVDDGSTDETLRIVRDWEGRSPGTVIVLSQANAGQGAARNAGLARATGEWVTFPDPDDVLAAGYLEAVDKFLRAQPEVAMVATNRIFLDDVTGALNDAHPLKVFFHGPDRARDLMQAPEYFHGGAPAAFFRLSTLRESGLGFDTRIRPNFEDGHFCCRYLLGQPRPIVAFVGSAHYHYRKRRDQSSTLQTSRTDRRRYTDVLRYGYLDVLETACRTMRTAPQWLQNFVLYELSYYFDAEDSASQGTAPPVATEEFHHLMGKITALLDPDVIAGFRTVALRGAAREALLHGYRGEGWSASAGVVRKLDDDQGLVEIAYYFVGAPPLELVLSDGIPVPATYGKIRDIRYHGRALVHERIVWLPAHRPLRLEIDGKALDLRFSPVPAPLHLLRPGQIEQRLRRRRPPAPAGKKLPFRGRMTLWLARRRPLRRRFRRAWVLMDRIHNADDSAEHLFDYLRDTRPDINSYFVVERGTPDWKRLRTRYGRRVIAHGSLIWKAAMINCRHLISSHADVAVCRPPAITALVQPGWRFTFLQHGVIKDDLSGWLNARPIDIFITSTNAEYESVAADHTPYLYTSKQTKLTGLPRFDLLLAAADRVPEESRDLVLVAPTWRVWLVPPLRAGSQRRDVVEGIETTDYAQNWVEFLSSEVLRATAERHGARIALLPHPNMAPMLDRLRLPPHVESLRYDGTDVRELFARAVVLVTDYSSVAFNAAYLDRPVVYFQFDRDRVLGGGHMGVGGYFDYERDGFGPVSTSVGDAVAGTVALIEAGGASPVTFTTRTAAAFPLRDGRCRERVTAVIEESTTTHDSARGARRARRRRRSRGKA